METHVVCFEGASSSSSGFYLRSLNCELSDMVREVVPDATVHTLEIASTRKLKKRLVAALEWCAPGDRVVFVGKSLGAVRMFQILDDLFKPEEEYVTYTCTARSMLPDAIVSIDPLSAMRLIVPYRVKVKKEIANLTVNVYNRGVTVRGADNRMVDYSHMEIVRSGAAKIAVMEAVKRCSE